MIDSPGLVVSDQRTVDQGAATHLVGYQQIGFPATAWPLASPRLLKRARGRLGTGEN
jgi:hypothetical protein